MPKRPPSSRQLSISRAASEVERSGPTARAVIVLLRAYRTVVTPLLGPACRFTPTCSAFAIEAVERHGAARGAILAARRLLRCHPWHVGGVDPVPATRRT